MKQPSSTAVLLINLGTPDAPTSPAVGRYLTEFLRDKNVIDIPALFRYPLVQYISTTRAPKSAEAYSKIWTERGSPLLFHTVDLTQKLKKAMPEYRVEFAMRYGNPSIRSVLESMLAKNDSIPIDDLVVVPLYPQYSLAATVTATEKVKDELDRIGYAGKVRFVSDFFDAPEFTESFASIGQREIEAFRPDHLLFSFHGLPERQIKKVDSLKEHCFLSGHCCDSVNEKNRRCYRAQSFATARAIAKLLQWPAERMTVSFQSRLGRTPWIKPYTDFMYPELAKKGVRKLLVFSPSFVADCLETLEEISIRGKADFISQGGADLKLVPSLNSESVWISGLDRLIRRSISSQNQP